MIHLPEQRKLAPCIPHDEARHAGGTGGGEHGVDDAQPPRPAGNGQGKQQRPHRDDQQKADADSLRRTAARQPALVGSACPLLVLFFPLQPRGPPRPPRGGGGGPPPPRGCRGRGSSFLGFLSLSFSSLFCCVGGCGFPSCEAPARGWVAGAPPPWGRSPGPRGKVIVTNFN